MSDIGETAVASRAVRLIDSMWRKIQSLEDELAEANGRIEELEAMRASEQQKEGPTK